MLIKVSTEAEVNQWETIKDLKDKAAKNIIDGEAYVNGTPTGEESRTLLEINVQEGSELKVAAREVRKSTG